MRLLDILIVALILAWLGGFSMHFGGGLIHIILILVIILLVLRIVNIRGNK